MNILFLNNGQFAPVKSHTMYTDLMRRFHSNGNTVCVVCAKEGQRGTGASFYNDYGIKIVCVKIGRLSKCSLIEKMITTITIADRYIAGIKKYFSGIKFDLILYPTPPITFLKVVEFIKNRDNSKSYLLLKDIFPQNAIDIGILHKKGIRGLIYLYFRTIEKRLYKVSDFIGCMSQANVDYILKNNPSIDADKVEICPNCVEARDKSIDETTSIIIRMKYGIPTDKKIFVYGGNLGKPQCIPFIIECIRKCQTLTNAFFLIVGSGSEYDVLERFFISEKPQNAKLLGLLSKEDYDSMVGACDVGMIFLDYRFTIPNFPSRLIAYMQAKIPVLAVTDCNSDIGKVVVEGGFGWWCKSDDAESFKRTIESILKEDLSISKETEFIYLNEHFSVERVYQIITRHLVVKKKV